MLVKSSPLSSPSSAQYQSERVGQLVFVAKLALGLALLVNLFTVKSWSTLGILAMGVLALCLAYIRLRRAAIKQAVNISLWSLTLVISILLTLKGSINHTAAMAYPGILICAAVLGGRRLFIEQFVFISLFFLSVGLLSTFDFLEYAVEKPKINLVITAVIIIFATAYGVFLFANDYKWLLKSLELENRRVVESSNLLEHVSRHDYLTGLPNILLCRDRFNQSVAQIERNKAKVAMLFVNLDDFKSVNSSLGYAIGDEVIRMLATRLTSLVHAKDTVSRIGGVEFLIVLEKIANDNTIAEITNKIATDIQTPCEIQAQRCVVTCSIGVAVAPDDGLDFDDMRKKANLAMSNAKSCGKNTIRFFDAAMEKEQSKHIELVKRLRSAVIDHQLEVYYQPIVDLKNKKIAAAEALIRWQTSDEKFISPAEFIPVAESTGMIVEIGEWVLKQACKQCAYWHKRGYPVRVSVNVSYIQFARGQFLKQVTSVLAETQLQAEYLDIELTESVLVADRKRFVDQLTQLKELGVGISIDDFGTGYSSLAYLSRFKVDKLKVDQSFIRDVHASEEDRAIVNAVIQMSNSLGMNTIAEGIETQAQCDVVDKLGCHYGQGYKWAKPMPYTEFIDYLEKSELIIE